MRKFTIIFTIIITAMIGYNSIAKEELVTEDGKVSAKSLPLDQETAKRSYQTATFGIG
ncbi:MAG: hypothetical protein ACPIA7_05635 [Akkermansiaceae bacterium]